MSTPETALITVQNQPQWLAAVPDEMKGQLVAKLQDAPKTIKDAISLVDPAMLAECADVDEMMMIIHAKAESMATDQQAKYYPAVWRIDHKSRKFVDDQGNVLGDKIWVVMLHFMPTRGFWVDGLTGNQPLCSAMGTWLKGTAGEDAQERWSKVRLYQPNMPITWCGKENACYNAKGEAACPFNAYGSNPKTGAGKACTEKYRNFMLPVDMSDGEFTGEGIMLNTPSTSLRKADEYQSRLKRYKPEGKSKVEQKTTLDVVTELSLEPAVGQNQDYAKVNFRVVRLLTTQELLFAYRLRKQIVAAADTIDISYGETYGESDEAGGPAPDSTDPDSPTYQAPSDKF